MHVFNLMGKYLYIIFRIAIDDFIRNQILRNNMPLIQLKPWAQNKYLDAVPHNV